MSVTFDKPVKQVDGDSVEYIAFARGQTLFQLHRGTIYLESGKINVHGKKAQSTNDKILDFEQQALTECKTNSVEWFGTTHFTAEYIDSKFTSSLSSEGENDSEVSFVSRPNKLRVYDHFQDLVKTPTKNVMKGNTILEFIGLVFKGTSIKSRFELKQIKLTFEPTRVTKFCLEDPVPVVDEPMEDVITTTPDEPVQIEESFESILEKM